MTARSAGSIALADDLTINRMGYGAMQLAGPQVFGPPKDRDEAVRVVRTAVERGVDYIDTSDFYGPHVTNEIIKEALAPYAEGVHIFTKVGALRGEDGSWIPNITPVSLKEQVHANLKTLGLDVLDVVYLRLPNHEGTTDDPISEEFGALAELRQEGLIRHLGLSGASDVQLTEAQRIAPVVAIQNLYNLVNRQDDALLERCARENIAFASFFPLGGFSPIQSDTLSDVAARVGASPQQVALAWLLQRSATSVVIPGTSKVAHLEENIKAAELRLPADAIAELDAIGA
ncbi:oxidoreductase [Planotetraspora phitsanulokensis]|uniref:Oxidoreductase n=1 Tax=Planotetraspora phitsanulokensis TaxID=575192 RepID=A0A8J3U1W6_9ACTN|nr:oxidoreductase [Planotetraspora phitsanulokensis]GII35821.1 oxidoreductase [Planotetraspora phitsanulokensis]